VRIVLVPGCLALLPEYASLRDPVAELRAAVLAAVSWLGEDVEIAAGDQDRRVAESLLAARPRTAGQEDGGRSVLVVGNGTARRTEKAPGHYHLHAEGYDEELRGALFEPCPEAVRGISDDVLATELWADLGAFQELGTLLEGARLAGVDYDDHPFGVQYWVLRWTV
jgi:hypothetical protein